MISDNMIGINNPFRITFHKYSAVPYPLACTLIGISLATVSHILSALSLTAQAEYADVLFVKSPVQWVAKILGALLVIIGGGASWLVVKRQRRRVGGMHVIFLILVVWMSVHLFIELFSGIYPYMLIGPKGPLTWLAMAAFFTGFLYGAHPLMDKYLKGMAVLGTVWVLYVGSQCLFANRIANLRLLMGPLQILLWFGPYAIIRWRDGRTTRELLFAVIVSTTLIMGSWLSGTRSWLVLSLLCFLMSLFKGKQRIISLALFTLTIIFAGIFFNEQLQLASALFSERLTSDTRTWQLQEFLAELNGMDLWWGRGTYGTWYFGGDAYQWVDGVFLLLVFIGGLPLALMYSYLVFLPSLRIVLSKKMPPLLKKSRFDAKACYNLSMDGPPVNASLPIALWFLACLGVSVFSAPDTSPMHYAICIYAGQSYRFLVERGG